MKSLSLPRLNTVGNTKNKKENSMKHTLYKKVKRGFTLIEMLIVMGIIDILVVLAVPALSTAMTDARKAKVSAYISQFNTALNRYVIAQETANSQVGITDLKVDEGWNKINKYLVINGGTNPTYEQFQKAVCNGGTVKTLTGGTVQWAEDLATVVGVSGIECQP